MRVRTLAGLLVLIPAGIFCVAYAPTNLGGHTTYVSTYGTSMLPRFHAGDLAVVQPASDYHVGDVVAYHSSTLNGATVLHRIVAIDGGRFTFKGDHNDFLDPVRPTADQLVGRLRFRVPHGGAVRSLLGKPWILFPLLAVAIGGAGSGVLTRKRRRRTDQLGRLPRTPARAPANRPRPRLGIVVPIAATVAAAGLALAAVAVWNIPRLETATRRERFAQTLTVGYSGLTRKGAAYPDGHIKTGDPIFTRLVTRIDIGLDYAFHADQHARRIGGTYQMVANVSSATGWSQSVPLTAARAFSGEHFHGAATLHLAQLQRLEAQFSAETGLVTTQATVSIAPRVHMHGDIAGTPFSGDVASKLDFQLSPVAMTPTSTGAAAPKSTSAGSVAIATVRPGGLSVWKLRISADAARIAVLVAFALVFCGAAAVLAIDRRRVALGEADAILRRYGRLLVTVGSVPPPGSRAVVRVESMRALARLAHLHERVILHASASGRHLFALSTDTVVYCYDTAPEIGPRAVPVPASA